MKKINKDKLDKLLVKGATLIDMRTPVQYRDAHLDNTTNLPFKNFLSYLLKHDKKTPIALIVNSYELDNDDIVMIGKYAEQLQFEKLYTIEYHQAQ